MEKLTKTLLATAIILGATPAYSLELTSKTFAPNTTLPKSMEYNSFGCTGDNKSPQLSWKKAPEGTKSYAITIHDPDAPTTSGWWHWTVYNIPANVTELAEGAAVPAGAQEGFTDYGTTGFGGACPPAGDKPHHYNITLYALKVDKLDLDPKTTAGAKLTYMLNANTIDKTVITGLYGR